MEVNNSTVLTIAVIVIAVLIILWLVWNFTRRLEQCSAATADPVGGVKCESLGPGKVKISWDPAPNADSYRVFINATPLLASSVAERKACAARMKVGACDGDNCCPSDCTACVSQTNYAKLIETKDTSVTVETCEPSICYIIVPYNRCGQAGSCKTVHFCDVECVVDEIDAWIVSNDCNGIKVAWHCPKCCDLVHIYIDGQLVATVDATELMWQGEVLPECVELALVCESSCGPGEPTILIPGCPGGGRKPRNCATTQVQVPVPQSNVPTAAPRATKGRVIGQRKK